MTTFSHGLERLTLDAVADYGRSQGYAIRVRQFHDMPDLWKRSYLRRMYKMTGISDVLVVTKRDKFARAEIAYCCGAKLDLVAFGLLHEIAHCEQVTQTPDWLLGYKGREKDIETDAWHRALRIAGEQAWEVTPEMVEFAQAALYSYEGEDELSEFVP